MRASLKILFILFLGLFYSCEEVVDVELDESPPRLVIEASILLDRQASPTTQVIRLSTTTAFFDTEIPPAIGARVVVYDEDGMDYYFEEIHPGYYRNNELSPVEGGQYFLEVTYEDEVYEATERFVTVPPIEYVVQNDEGGFTGNDIELRLFYTDPADEENFYLFRFMHNDLSIQISDDELVNGNLTSQFFTSDNLSSGDEVRFEIQGISRRFYDYMFILRSQAGAGGGPFETQPTTVRGNIVNVTNQENYPLGFFRLSQIDYLNYTVE